MNRESIMKMEPGRELDQTIAIKIMGYEKSRHSEGYVRIGSLASLPKPYSRDVAAAWEVVDKLRETHTIFSMARKWDEWEAVFVPVMKNHGKAAYSCKTAPEAIVKAALLTVLEDKDHD